MQTYLLCSCLFTFVYVLQNLKKINKRKKSIFFLEYFLLKFIDECQQINKDQHVLIFCCLVFCWSSKKIKKKDKKFNIPPTVCFVDSQKIYMSTKLRIISYPVFLPGFYCEFLNIFFTTLKKLQNCQFQPQTLSNRLYR